MAVFRVERTRDYTVMSNHHLRDKSLSLKAKGLLSLMLSLPEDWDYTLSGLARICQEGKDAIRGAIVELERAGYVQRRQTTDETGKFSVNEYIIREQPVAQMAAEEPDEGPGELPSKEAQEEQLPEGPNGVQSADLAEVQGGVDDAEAETSSALPLWAFPLSENPMTEKPPTADPSTVFPTQIKKDTRNKNQENTNSQRTPSLPFSPSAPPFMPTGERKERKRRGRGEAMDPDEMADCRAQILGNIGYTELVRERPWDKGQVDELVELMVEAACSKRETIRVAGNEVPQALVRRRLLGLSGDHLNFVLDCLQRNTTQVRNIKQYLLTSLYNAPVTMENCYVVQAGHMNR